MLSWNNALWFDVKAAILTNQNAEHIIARLRENNYDIGSLELVS